MGRPSVGLSLPLALACIGPWHRNLGVCEPSGAPLDWGKRLACHFDASDLGLLLGCRLALNESESILILVIVVHSDNFVIRGEQGYGDTGHKGNKAPRELLLDEQQFERQHDQKKTADV